MGQLYFTHVLERQEKKDQKIAARNFFLGVSAGLIVLANAGWAVLNKAGYYWVSMENGCHPSKWECYSPLPEVDWTIVANLVAQIGR
jgi:hypothetical protein